MNVVPPIINGWERALMAAERVKERLHRATRAFDAAAIPYAVAGGNAVAEWVARADEGAVRNTRDVDLLIRRNDLAAVRAALEGAAFVYQHMLDVDKFLDGPEGRPSEAVHILYASESVKPEYQHASPGLEESERAAEFQVVALAGLVRMKLVAGVSKIGFTCSISSASARSTPPGRLGFRRTSANGFSNYLTIPTASRRCIAKKP